MVESAGRWSSVAVRRKAPKGKLSVSSSSVTDGRFRPLLHLQVGEREGMLERDRELGGAHSGDLHDQPVRRRERRLGLQVGRLGPALRLRPRRRLQRLQRPATFTFAGHLPLLSCCRSSHLEQGDRYGLKAADHGPNCVRPALTVRRPQQHNASTSLPHKKSLP